MPASLPPFRFGIQCSSPPDITARRWRDLARKVEDLGCHRLTVSDHLDDQLSPVAALMAAADAIGCPVGTIRSRVARARGDLLDLVEDRDGHARGASAS